MAAIIPGIFELNPIELTRKIILVSTLVDSIHINISDSTLASDKTVTMGFEKILAPFIASGILFEAHLMVRKPEAMLRELAFAGFKRIIASVECDDPREFLADGRTHEVEVGLSIDVDTDIEVMEPFLEDIDCALVEMAEVGPAGQDFQPEMVEKIKAIHRNFPDLPVAAESGIDEKNIRMVVDAGAHGIVTASYIFKDEHAIAASLAELQTLAG